MELNGIKKRLYKDNTTARFINIKKGIASYNAYFDVIERDSNGEEQSWIPHLVHFAIPVEDMGDASFYRDMEAKHLIRWIVKEEE